jgi:Fe2+ transport system protein FeoA
LLAQRLMEMGWLAVMEGKQCTVTAAGLAGLRQLGVHFRTNE